MRTPRIGVLNNLRAGRKRLQSTEVFEVLRRHPDVLQVDTDSSLALPEALAELERHEVDVLVTNGGDGTVQYALTELLQDPARSRLPLIAPLCGGRTNMTSKDLGADRHPARGLLRVIEAARDHHLDALSVSRPVLRVRSSRRQSDQYGMFFGAGLIHRAIGVVHRVFPPGRSQGLFGASVVTGALMAKVLFRPTEGILTPDKCAVRAEDRELVDTELYLLIASTLDHLFLRMNPFWGEGSGGVRLTAIASRAQHMARAVPSILAGRASDVLHPDHGYTSVRSENAGIRMSCGFTVDGELFDPEPEEEVELTADRRITFLRA